VRHWKPDFLVIDLHLPDTNGYACWPRCAASSPRRRCRPSCARQRKSATWRLQRAGRLRRVLDQARALQTVLAELARRAGGFGMTFRVEPPYHHGQADRTAVLLVNLGTPDAPTAGALRRYLAEFLSDPRVVEIPRLVWLPILHGIILRTRPARSAAKYASVWMPEGSPLAVWTARQAAALAQTLTRPATACWCATPCATATRPWPR
jgi:hypothetical protein